MVRKLDDATIAMCEKHLLSMFRDALQIGLTALMDDPSDIERVKTETPAAAALIVAVMTSFVVTPDLLMRGAMEVGKEFVTGVESTELDWSGLS